QPHLRARAGRAVRAEHRRAAVRRDRGRPRPMNVPPGTLPAPPQATEQQRLGATLVLSALVHGLLILGVGFAVSDNAPLVPTLDVIFSQTSTPLTPKQADFLAQANQQGGGDHDTPQRPRDTQG